MTIAPGAVGPAPLLFFYTHLHDAIREELDSLADAVLQLENNEVEKIASQLTHLRARYRFLEQVYKYHSSVEDEVVYPALDLKVKNVTRAYTVEHEDEEHLLEELLQLLSKALATCSGEDVPAPHEKPPACGVTLRQLARKVEEVHTTLRKHLAKEEHQLLPLLLQNFDFSEQASLVAQFLCSIPLAAVHPVLLWIKRTIPLDEQTALRGQVEAAVPDNLLKQLMVTWLAPTEFTHRDAAELRNRQGGDRAEPRTPEPSEGSEFVCCGGCTRHHQSGEEQPGEDSGNNNGTTAAAAAAMGGSRDGVVDVVGHCSMDVEDAAVRQGDGTSCSNRRPPLREILYFHQAIRSALSSFAEEARALRDGDAGGGSAKLAGLVERHRFIRAVCLFHSSSEDEVVFPALRRVASSSSQHGQHGAQHGMSADDSGAVDASKRHRCEEEHSSESAQLEELGRLLGDVRACVRRGAKGVEVLTQDLSQVADRLARAMSRHMAREESEVLPPLMRSLCLAEQRHMVWRLVRAMPLRLLERVMPWVAGKLREDDVKEWLENIRRAAPAEEAPLVELLSQWAWRGGTVVAAAGGDNGHVSSWRRGTDDPTAYSIQTCTPTTAGLFLSTRSSSDTAAAAMAAAAAAATAAATAAGPPLKRIKTSAGGPTTVGMSSLRGAHSHHQQAVPMSVDGNGALGHLLGNTTGSDPSLPTSPHTNTPSAGQDNPIDHIFQFHKALRRELKELESEAVELQALSDAAAVWTPGDALTRAIQDLQARFQFLRGIYRAHSSSEDEVIFPALESKDSLHNISHAYALDHKQEESLFEEVAEVIDGIGACAPPDGLPNLRSLVSRLARMCAAVRAALETHLRAEETELWPLFAENFSVDEQQRLVGIIIGRTGAEVLHTMLSWVKGSMDEEEHSAMMLSLKSASKATAFEQWLETQGVVEGRKVQGGSSGAGGSSQHQGSVSVSASANNGIAGLDAASPASMWEDEQREVLAEVARYLAKHNLSGGGGSNSGVINAAGVPGGSGGSGIIAGGPAVVLADPASIAADAAHFRPGWEDIFRMNQKQLEVAVRRVSADATLEPQRKAYLIQHLMASRYIVAQQRRAAQTSAGPSAGVTPTVAGRAAVVQGTQIGSAGSAGGTMNAAAIQNVGIIKPQESLPPASGTTSGPQQGSTFQHRHSQNHRHYFDATAEILGCKHYRRRAILVAPCCSSEHVCRLCHDEAIPGHSLDRYAVSEMRCMECGTKQPVGASCGACGASMARYYCGICHLFDDDPHRDIYHCPFCNFCRRGKGLGVDSFHCMSCNACMSLELFNKHRCKERALAGTCPVCSDPLFDSSAPIKELPCGHFMHSMCFAAYTRYSYTCPVCSKSLGDMSVYWRMIDTLLESEALPMEYASRQQGVRCNDCATETQAPFHFVYHKCGGCGGYNTRVI